MSHIITIDKTENVTKPLITAVSKCRIVMWQNESFTVC